MVQFTAQQLCLMIMIDCIDHLSISIILVACQDRRDCADWTFREHISSQTYECYLLSSCHLQQNLASYPTLTTSGSNSCVPEPFKRRKCLPGCRRAAPFCHGRFVYLFHHLSFIYIFVFSQLPVLVVDITIVSIYWDHTITEIAFMIL